MGEHLGILFTGKLLTLYYKPNFMKRYCLLLILVFTFVQTHAKVVSGYIVLLNNDTVQVQIKSAGGFFFGIRNYNPDKEVEIIDSSGSSKLLTTNDIKAYGYTDKSKQYVYRVKPVENGSFYFLALVTGGHRTSLYQYERTVSTGPNTSSVQQFYTFERANGTYLFLTNYASLVRLKEKISAFYRDHPAIEQLMGGKFESRRQIQRDIRAILEGVNNQ
jgi:hypothetical protein